MGALSVLSDVIIIALCVGVAAYCRLLHQRLDRLRDVDTGLGAVIGRLNSGVNEMQQSFESTRSTVKQHSESLRDVIDEGSSLADYLTGMMKQANALRENISSLTAPMQEAVETLQTRNMRPTKRVSRNEPLRATRNTESRETTADPLADIEPAGLEQYLRNRLNAATGS